MKKLVSCYFILDCSSIPTIISTLRFYFNQKSTFELVFKLVFNYFVHLRYLIVCLCLVLCLIGLAEARKRIQRLFLVFQKNEIVAGNILISLHGPLK
jgi:hypothetical protein